MEEMEVPTEHLSEEIKEKAEEGREKWAMYVAITTALMAVFAALGSLMAGHHSNEALISQIKASDQWSYYNTKGIKYEISQATILQHAAVNAEPPAEVKERRDKFKADQADIMEKAKESEKESERHLEKHSILAKSVTLFQISIAISAIAMLTKKKFLWYFSLILSIVGVLFFVSGGWYPALYSSISESILSLFGYKGMN